MGFGAAVSSCFNKYASFSGRAPRSEYWWWILFCLLSGIGAGIVSAIFDIATGNPMAGHIILGAVELALFLPSLAVVVRRLHDLNRSGWWYGAMLIIWVFLVFLAGPTFIRIHENQLAGVAPTDGLPSSVFLLMGLLGLIECIYSIMLLIWFCMRGTRGENRFGADPLREF